MFRHTKLCTGLVIAFGGLAIAPGAVMAQEASLQRVEITGSSIKRIDAETALPLTIIKREDIEKSGASNVQELIDRVSSNNGGGRSMGESIGESSASGQTGASLRALGRERTLVLLNGRRLPSYPFSGLGVDLNAIPLAAIERIEILRDGASAVYGSDAIGGVLNFITRKDYQGRDLTVSMDKPTQKGGQVGSISAGIGFGDLGTDRYNVFATASYQGYDVVKASDRSYALTGNLPALGIVKFSSNTYPANGYLGAAGVGPTGAVVKAGTYVPGVSGYPNCAPPDSFNYAGACRYDYTNKIDLIPESERFGFLTRGIFQLDKDNQLFAEYSYSKNDIILGLSQTPTVTTGRASFYYPAFGAVGSSNKYYPTAAVNAVAPGYTDKVRIAWRVTDGGQRRDTISNDMDRIVLGGEGTVAGWDYKAAVTRSESHAVDSFLSGNYSDTKLKAALATGNLNPWGPNDATGLALLAGAQLSGAARSSKTSTTGLDAQLSREIFTLPAGPVSLAVGFETRRDKYFDGYSDLSASGDVVGGSGTAGAVSGQRDTTAFFSEVNVPVVKGLELMAAVRHDSYSKASGSSRDGAFSSNDLGATSPKVGLRWQVSKELLFRGSIGKGFRAPALDNLYAPSSFTNTGGNFTDPYFDAKSHCATNPDPTYCDTQLSAQNNSNPNLKAENSQQKSLGMVFEPTKDLSIGVDYFDIKITNGITALTGDDIMIDWYKHQTGPTTSTSVYANRLVLDANGVLNYIRASLENVGEARVVGFDLSAKYKLRTGMGTFTPAWEGTVMTKSNSSNIVTGDVSDTLGVYARGGPTLKFKQTLDLDWEQGPLTAGAGYYWQSGYTDYDGTSKVPSYSLLSLRVGYSGIKNLKLSASVANVLDKKPPVSVQEDYFAIGFDPTYADQKGRTLQLKAAFKF